MRPAFLALVLLPCILFEARGQRKNLADRSISIGIMASPDFSYRTLRENAPGTGNDLVIDSRNEQENPNFGYTTGIVLNMSLSQKIRLNTGFCFSTKGYRTKEYELFYGPPPLPTEPTAARVIYRFDYIEIPVLIDFILRKGKMSLIPAAGITLQCLIKAKNEAKLDFEDGHSESRATTTTGDFRKFNLSPTVGFGLEYKPCNNLVLVAAPTFRYGLVKIVDKPVTEFLWNVGLNLSVRRTIR
jgi:hypothetical protein